MIIIMGMMVMIYILWWSVCVCVTKNDHFLKRSVCQPWKWRSVVSWFLVGFHVFQGGFMVFNGFWLVSMVFQGGFIVFHVYWLVSMIFKVVSWFTWFWAGFHGFSRWFHSSSWFFNLVFLGFWLVSRWFHGFHGFWLVSMVFQGGFMVYHDFWLVSMVFSRWFHGLSWFLVGFHGFVSWEHHKTVSWPNDPV